jgi:hypothetical protein
MEKESTYDEEAQHIPQKKIQWCEKIKKAFG